MIVNVNARMCSNGGIYVDYQLEGKRMTAAFIDWAAFITWLKEQIDGKV